MRLVRFSLPAGSEEQVGKLADDLVPFITALKGCRDVKIVGDHSIGEYALAVLWSDRGDADAAAQVAWPRFEALLDGKSTTPPEMHLFEVLKSS
jgi:hypothetical protein